MRFSTMIGPTTSGVAPSHDDVAVLDGRRKVGGVQGLDEPVGVGRPHPHGPLRPRRAGPAASPGPPGGRRRGR